MSRLLLSVIAAGQVTSVTTIFSAIGRGVTYPRLSVYGYLRLSRDSARAVDLGEVVARIFTFTKPSAACPLLLSNLYSFIV